MKQRDLFKIILLLTVFSFNFLLSGEKQEKPIVIVIHGGAGYLSPENTSPEKITAFKVKMKEALKTGYNILKKGGSSLDAVEATIIILEDSPLFNAGKGSVFTNEGKNELDSGSSHFRLLRKSGCRTEFAANLC